MENEEMDTKLQVVAENGQTVEIDVIDIFHLEDEETEYIIYSIGESVYASILAEDEEGYELKTIENQSDLNKIMARIDELLNQEK
jgi:predicted nucleotidyltransferase component of viral defense system